MSTDQEFMAQALVCAREAAAKGEVPVGAVVVCDGKVIAQAANAKESLNDPSAHAEVLALRAAAAKLQRWRLTGCTLYSTLEPCVMCAGACVQARVDRVVFGAADPKFGGVESLYSILDDKRANHRCEFEGGVCRLEAAELLRSFFQKRRRESGST